MNMPDDPLLLAAEARNGQLRGIIASALTALNEGRHGDVRRILTGGTDKGLMAGTGVIAKDAP